MSNDNSTQLAITAGMGLFVSTLDSGIINIAIPQLMKDFHSPINTVIWTVTLYTLTLISSILLFGRLSDRFGRLKIYCIGLMVFGIGSLLCGIANHMVELILFRGIQGIGAGMIQATALALVTTRLHSQSLVKCLTLLGMILGLGPLFAPAAGGLILSTLGWRWIFWLNIPIVLVGMYLCFFLSKEKEKLTVKKIPIGSLIVFTIATFMALMCINAAISWIIGSVLTIISMSVYIVLELKTKHPLLPWYEFKRLAFSAPIVSIMSFGGSTTGVFMLPPLYFQTIRNLDAFHTGLLCLSAPFGLILAAKLSSKMIIKKGRLIPIMLGLSIMALALGGLSYIQPHVNMIFLLFLLALYGVGGGLFQSACYIQVTHQFSDAEQGLISSLIRLFQNLAIAFSSALFAFFIHHQPANSQGFMTGIHQGFTAALLSILIAIIMMLISLKQKETRYGLS